MVLVVFFVFVEGVIVVDVFHIGLEGSGGCVGFVSLVDILGVTFCSVVVFVSLEDG